MAFYIVSHPCTQTRLVGAAGAHHDGLAGVDAHGVEVLHVTHRNAVVVAVAHHLRKHAERISDQNPRKYAEQYLI